ncbi:hypothetical protein JZU69_04245, partial [bacterium]|nr:hypothetical protein [bacterium]
MPSWADFVVLHRDIVRAKAIEAKVESGTVLALVDAKYETLGLAEKLQPEDTVLAGLLATCAAFSTIEAERRLFVSKAISVPELAERNEDFIGALNRLVGGKSAFAFPIGKGDARRLVAAVTVLGSSPKKVQDWQEVQSLVQW